MKLYHWKNLEVRLLLSLLFRCARPACIEHSIPQAKRVHQTFSSEDVAVIGLHTVFEHHQAMKEESLKAFLHEYRVNFPVAIDLPSDDEHDPIPQTMRTYRTQGTPTLLLFDRNGCLRKHKFGHQHDLVLGAEIMALLREESFDIALAGNPSNNYGRCSVETGCQL
ncbi:MAG: TlpA disulfide reductase family protein [Xenococcaceae cyanobacterium MO_188.B32]|nr:TlpA disulfide reductase family protein [Xenococcaceae cyanobacterium MO_188.B32]